MTFNVTVSPSNKQFSVNDDETILEAGLRQGVAVPCGCRNGACGSCKARVLGGQIELGPHSDSALRADEVANGYTLLCCTHARSDVSVECDVILSAGDMPLRKMPCRIASIEKLAPDVVVLKLQLPANERLQYLAGQFIELTLKDGARRSYSMACAPHLAEQLELHVRHMPGGRFTDALFGVTQPAVQERDILRLEGPMGTFFLREQSKRPIVLLASGTGFAPIKAIVEYARHKGFTRPMTLYWGGRRPSDLYMNALAEQWAREIEWFSYVPVVSDALPEDAWQGRSGFVHRAVMADFPDLSGYQVYACGAPVVVDSARRDFTSACGLPEAHFLADSFTSAADLAKAG